jgi:hypothetical protein
MKTKTVSFLRNIFGKCKDEVRKGFGLWHNYELYEIYAYSKDSEEFKKLSVGTATRFEWDW